MFQPFPRTASLFLLVAGAFLPAPALAADPVFLTNATDRPWRLLSAIGLDQPLEVTTQGDGAQPSKRVYPAYDSKTWVGLKGASTLETTALRKAYTNFFVLDAIVPPGRTIQLEHTGAYPMVHANFYLCDANDHSIYMGDTDSRRLATVAYEVEPPTPQGTPALGVRLRPYWNELTRAVLLYSESNPSVLTIARPDWGSLPTFRCNTPTPWSERVEAWERDAKASGADPIGNEIAWQKARKATPQSPAPGGEEKGPALERKE